MCKCRYFELNSLVICFLCSIWLPGSRSVFNLKLPWFPFQSPAEYKLLSCWREHVCLFSKEFFQNIKNNLTTFLCNPSQVEQVQWNLYGKIICLCNYNVYESKFAKVKHKSEVANSFCFLPGHLKYDNVFEKFIFEHLRSKPAWHLNKWKGNRYIALLKASRCSGVFSRTI